jgi:hypothetical protein
MRPCRREPRGIVLPHVPGAPHRRLRIPVDMAPVDRPRIPENRKNISAAAIDKIPRIALYSQSSRLTKGAFRKASRAERERRLEAGLIAPSQGDLGSGGSARSPRRWPGERKTPRWSAARARAPTSLARGAPRSGVPVLPRFLLVSDDVGRGGSGGAPGCGVPHQRPRGAPFPCDAGEG